MKHFILYFLTFISLKALAHPVIYQGGWALSSANMSSYSNNYAMYSFTQRFALGMDQWRFTKKDKNNEAGLLKLNHLLWRDNGSDHQANVYLHGGAGIMDQEWNQKKTTGTYLAGIDADWETQKYFTSFKHYQFPNTFITQARVGIAPYVGDFKGLQTWFMVQGMVIHEVQDKVMVTPMVRFFYKNVLWEMGSSTRGDWMLNLMIHI